MRYKNRFSVGLATESRPHNQSTSCVPICWENVSQAKLSAGANGASPEFEKKMHALCMHIHSLIVKIMSLRQKRYLRISSPDGSAAPVHWLH